MITPNSLHHGDCMELLLHIPDNSIDMVLCDLPYNTTALEWDVLLPLDELWKQYKRIVKPKGAIALFAVQPFSSLLVNSNLKMFRHSWVWDKIAGGNFIHARHQPIKVHEEVLVFSRESANYYPIMELADKPRKKANPVKKKSGFLSGVVSGEFKHSEGYDGSLLYPKSIVTFSAQAAECNNKYRQHPTQKPISVCEYLIRTYTQPNDSVLDNTMGSGSTCVAAIHAGRSYIGMEKEQAYFDIAMKRVEEVKKQRLLQQEVLFDQQFV